MERFGFCLVGAGRAGMVQGIIIENAFRSWRDRFRDEYLNEMKSFIECILKDTPPHVSGYDGLAAVKAVVAANASLKKGMPVVLQD